MKRITILLADDNKLVRQGFRKILEREDDLEVVGEAKNGLQAVAMVKKLHPALVLMDISMPGLNGLEATRQILKAASGTNLRKILRLLEVSIMSWNADLLKNEKFSFVASCQQKKQETGEKFSKKFSAREPLRP